MDSSSWFVLFGTLLLSWLVNTLWTQLPSGLPERRSFTHAENSSPSGKNCPDFTGSISTSDQILCQGESTVLTLSFSGGTPPYNVIFTTNGAPVPLPGINNGHTIAVNPGVSTNYQISMITDSENCLGGIGTGGVIIFVIPTPTVNPAGPLVECDEGGGTAEFNLTSLNFTINNSSGFPVRWYSSQFGQDLISTPQNFLSPSATVYASVINGECESERTPVNLVVQLNPAPQITGDLGLCPNETTVLNAGDGYASYWWSTQTSSQSITVGFGSYSVTVSDGNGCTGSANADVELSPVIELICQQIYPASSVSDSDGQASITISGGFPIFEVHFLGPESDSIIFSGGGNILWSSLPPGNYHVEATDDFGCSGGCDFTIGILDCGILPEISGNAPSCAGAFDGSVWLTVMGGVSPLGYDWNIDTLDGMQGGDGLEGGFYQVTVSGSDGCQAVASITLEEPFPLQLNCQATVEVSTVDGSDGQATAILVGGTAPYNLQWAGPAQGELTQADPGTVVIANLPEGEYGLIMTDANDCQVSCSFTIAGPDCELSLSVEVQSVSCNGNADGAIDLSINGNMPPFGINWDEDSLDGLDNPTNIPAGTYNVTITDSLNCTISEEISIAEPPSIILECVVVSTPTAMDSDDGQAGLIVGGGLPGYSITWSGPTGGSLNISEPDTIFIADLAAGAYVFELTDAGGCPAGCSFIMPPFSGGPGNEDCSTPLLLSLSSPPQCRDTFFLNNNGAGFSGVFPDLSDCDPGSLPVNQPSDVWFKFSAQASLLLIRLEGNLNTPVIAILAGEDCENLELRACKAAEPGTGALELLVEIVPGTAYTLVVGGSESSDQGEFILVIEQIAEAQDILSEEETEICVGDSAVLSASGNYTYYSWSDGATTMENEILSGGVFSITATDNAGCRFVDEILVTVNAAPVADAGEDQNLHCNEPVFLNGTGSSAGSQYTWSTPDGLILRDGETLTPEVGAPGMYLLEVANSSGCSARDTVFVFPDNLIPADAGSDRVLCEKFYRLEANLPVGVQGYWSVPAQVTIDDSSDPRTNISELAGGANVLLWTLSTEFCPDYSVDTIILEVITVSPQDDTFPVNAGIITQPLDVLANDGPAENTGLTLTVIEDPWFGSIQIQGDGLVLYTPNVGFSGTDVFTYELCEPDCGNCASAKVFLNVEELPPIKNVVITPNGDGINDDFFLDIFLRQPNNYLRIFDRMGTIVFEQKNYTGGWQGIGKSSRPLPEASYYYTLTFGQSSRPPMKGSITIKY